VQSGDGAKCAEKFCGGKRTADPPGQYGASTACFKLGTGAPHPPRADDCRTQTKSEEDCLKCCDKQADYWNNVWIKALEDQIKKLEATSPMTEEVQKKIDKLKEQLEARKKNREKFRTECKDICKKVQPLAPTTTTMESSGCVDGSCTTDGGTEGGSTSTGDSYTAPDSGTGCSTGTTETTDPGTGYSDEDFTGNSDYSYQDDGETTTAPY
jgi:hypothetical protein